MSVPFLFSSLSCLFVRQSIYSPSPSYFLWNRHTDGRMDGCMDGTIDGLTSRFPLYSTVYHPLWVRYPAYTQNKQQKITRQGKGTADHLMPLGICQLSMGCHFKTWQCQGLLFEPFIAVMLHGTVCQLHLWIHLKDPSFIGSRQLGRQLEIVNWE